jgi:S-DNA-T family DNA segregation ATPase FtsK/SpoIIIE
MYEAAIDVIVREGRGSVSLLQRALGIGYGRGARLIDFMAEDGIVGTYNGSQAREVLVTPEQWAQMQAEANGTAPPAVLAPAAPRRNKIEVTPRRPSPMEEDEFATAEEAESQLAAAAKSRRTVRPADEEEEEGTEDEDSEYGIRAPVEISREDETDEDEDSDEVDEAESDEGDEDDQHVSEWHDDEGAEESDESDDSADEDEEDKVEEYAELDEEEREPINAPRLSAGKIEAKKPARGKSRQSRSA